MKFKLFILTTAFLTFTSLVATALPRDASQRAAFQRENACPTTGKKRGACKGYQVDHKKALMNGGADKPKNMQWLSEKEHKVKTKQDIATCKASYLCKNKRLSKKLGFAKNRSHHKKRN